MKHISYPRMMTQNRKTIQQWFIVFLLSIISAKLTAQVTGLSDSSLNGRTPVNLNIVRDFGADPTGKTNSTWAFIKAARYIQNRWDKTGKAYAEGIMNINYLKQYVILNIPNGNYQVGRQVDLKTFDKGSHYLYDCINIPSSFQSKIPYYQLFQDANIDSVKNSEGLIIRPFKYSDELGGNNHFYTQRFISTDVFSINNNRKEPQSGSDENLLNGIIIRDTINTNSRYTTVRINDMNNLVIGFLDSTHANDPGLPQFGNIRYEQEPYLTASGNTLFGFDYPWGLEAVNQWSDSPIMNVEIKNINIDGHNITYYFGGRKFYHGAWYHAESGSNGITLYNTKNITIQNCKITRMGRDGIYLNDAAYKSSTNIVIKNVSIDSSIRQGMSVCGVNGMVIDSCSFRYTGRSKSVHENTILFASPASGIDIEPELGINIYNGYKEITRGNFNVTVSNSVLAYNSLTNVDQFPFTAKSYGDGSDTNSYSKNWDFVNDLFENDTVFIPSTETYIYEGNYISQPFFRFSKCIFHDRITVGKTYHLENGETIFDSCTFEDKTNRGGHMPEGTRLISGYENHPKFTLNGCTFIINDSTSLGMLAISLWDANPSSILVEDSDYTRVKNCTFNFNSNAKHYNGVFWPTGASCLFRYIRFQGVNNFNSLATTNPNYILSNGVIFEGSGFACNQNAINLNGAIWWNHYSINSNLKKYENLRMGYKYLTNSSPFPADSMGYSNLFIGKNALFEVQGNSIYINKNSKITCGNMGSLFFMASNVFIKGKIIAFDNSYFNLYANTKIYNSSPYYYIHSNTFWGFNPIYSAFQTNMAPFNEEYANSASVNTGSFTGINNTINGNNSFIASSYKKNQDDGNSSDALFYLIDSTTEFRKISSVSGDFSFQFGVRLFTGNHQQIFFNNKKPNGKLQCEFGINADNYPYIQFDNQFLSLGKSPILPDQNYILTVSRINGVVQFNIDCVQ